jgi:hypothetical protein
MLFNNMNHWVYELCEFWGVHDGDNEECRLLGYEIPVRTSQKTLRLRYKVQPVNALLRLEIFTAASMKNGVFWDVKPCGFCKNRRFGGKYRLHHKSDRLLHGFKSHQTVLLMAYLHRSEFWITRKHSVSVTASVSFFRWEERDILLLVT